jgi:RNA polymerase sigma-70 factor (ECF subfamily)
MDEAAPDEIRSLWESGDFDAATTQGIHTYGHEVFAFLVSRERSEDRASDVFSIACEDLWRSMPEFQWRCSLRTWFYRLARNAAVRYGKRPANQAARHRRMSQIPEIVDKARSRTLVHLRTEVKSDLDKLREQLSPEDQALLVLRVDRQLSWTEIAQVMSEDAGLDESADELTRASARMRQRFQKLKKRLRTLAEQHGLLDHAEN